MSCCIPARSRGDGEKAPGASQALGTPMCLCPASWKCVSAAHSPRNSDPVQRDQELNRVEFGVKSDQGHGKVTRDLSPYLGTRMIEESPDFLYI